MRDSVCIKILCDIRIVVHLFYIVKDFIEIQEMEKTMAWYDEALFYHIYPKITIGITRRIMKEYAFYSAILHFTVAKRMK